MEMEIELRTVIKSVGRTISIVGGGGVSLDMTLGSERASISGWVWGVRIWYG